MHLRLTMMGICLAAGLLGFPAGARAQDGAAEAPPHDGAPAVQTRCEGDLCEVRYRTRFEGAPSGDVESLLESASQLKALEDKPPRTMAGLRRRAEGDMERMRVALKSEGYYTATARYDIDRDRKPVRVTVVVEPGPLYRMRSFFITPVGPLLIPRDVRFPEEGADVGMAPGAPARGPDIVTAQGQALASLRNQGYPFVSLVSRRLFINTESHLADVRMQIDPGPRAVFGPLQISGLDRVKPRFVEAYRSWEEGQRFDSSHISRFAENLQNTGLFSSVRVRPAEEVGDGDRLPVIVELQERKRRTIGVGATYSTSEGPGGTVFWEHRNLSGEGEKVRFDLAAAKIKRSFRGTYEEPQFFRFDQKLVAKLELATDRTDAYDSDSITTSLGVERRLSRTWKAGVAGEFEYARTDDGVEKTDAYTFGVPLSASLDTTDNLLHPKKGVRVLAVVTPTVGFNDGQIFYRKYEFRISAYRALDKKKRYVLAGRARAGAIEGAGTGTVPPRQRFYAGGGGSLRAYEFQAAGPLVDPFLDPSPAGGRGVFEVAGEMRINVTDTIGVAPFIEAGAAFEHPLPRKDEDIFSGAGLGLWYDTPVGPFRVDVAVPLFRRDDIDRGFQIYVSLGQSF